MTLQERLLRQAYRLGSHLLYRSGSHADWAFEKIQRPVNVLGLMANLACYRLRIPRIMRVVTAMVEPVFGCNLRCKTCWGTLDLKGRRPPFMEWDLFTKIVDQMPRSVEAITFSLMGEPLLHERLPEMIDYASAEGFRTILFTNGTQLEGERLERLAKASLDVINVSIEADAKNAQDMRGIDLDRLKENIRAYLSVKPARTDLKLSIVAHPGNLEKMANLNEDWRAFAEHIKMSPQLGLADELGPAPLCLEPWRGNLNFYTNGYVSPCCCDWYTELTIGDMHSEDLRNIIRGERYREVLRGFLNGDVPDICRRCKEFTVPGAPLRLKKRFPGEKK